MTFPELDEALRLERLHPPTGKVRMVLDTDTYNEVDDQFALTYALQSPDRLDVEAVYAAPFKNNRAPDPAEGMQQSYDEILRILERLDVSPDGFALRGSTTYVPDADTPVESEAAADLVERGMRDGGDPLYVVAIGAITNVAAALMMEPRLVEKVVVLWLGGQPLYWPWASHFNLGQDLHASRLVFDCGVPLVHFPCDGVASHMLTNLLEIDAYVRGRGAIGDHLADTYKAYFDDHTARTKEIWDIITIGYLVNPEWVRTELVHSPVLTDQFTWSVDHSRHFIRNATRVRRDPIFRDMFGKLAAAARSQVAGRS